MWLRNDGKKRFGQNVINNQALFTFEWSCRNDSLGTIYDTKSCTKYDFILFDFEIFTNHLNDCELSEMLKTITMTAGPSVTKKNNFIIKVLRNCLCMSYTQSRLAIRHAWRVLMCCSGRKITACLHVSCGRLTTTKQEAHFG